MFITVDLWDDDISAIRCFLDAKLTHPFQHAALECFGQTLGKVVDAGFETLLDCQRDPMMMKG